MKKWNKIKLGDILEESKIPSENPDPNKRISVMLNVNGVKKRPYTNEKKDATKYYKRKSGQFIYGKQNFHKGAFGIIPEELDGYESSSDIPAFDINDKCLPEWIFYFFKQNNFYKQLNKFAKGAGSQRVQPKHIFNLEIPVPPLDEQRAIINKTKYIESKSNKLSEEIEKQRTYIQKLRQQILQEAIQGELTKEWRRQNPNVEPASDLLKRIKAEKERLVKEGKIKKSKPLPPVKEEEKPFDLPEGWVWCRLGEVLNTFLNGYAYKSQSFKKSGYNQVLRLGNVKNDRLLLSNAPVYISDQLAKDTKQFKLYPDDILITMTGTRAKQDYCFTKLLNNEDFQTKNLYLNQRVGCLRFNNSINKNYLTKILKANLIIAGVFNLSTGSANQANIGKEAILNILLPIPPIEEQQLIMDKLEKSNLKLNNLQEQTEKNGRYADKLMQAVLREAFEG